MILRTVTRYLKLFRMDKTIDKKTVMYVVGGALVIVLVIGFLKFNPFGRKHTRMVGDCEVTVEDIVMGDDTMTGIFNNGEELTVEKGYYVCNSPIPGDTVLYRYSEARNPVIKRVVAVEGDKFQTVKDSKGRGWNLEVNGDKVEAGDDDYYFGSPNPPTISLYEKERNFVLRKGEVIVFSAVPPGREDSGVFGIVSTGDLIGRVKK